MIFDFDGTLTRLQIDWADLRSRLSVSRISDLWSSPDHIGWSLVALREIEACQKAPVNPTLLAMLDSPYVVVSNNSSKAIRHFLRLHRSETVAKADSLILGREELGGPKEDFGVFGIAIQKALCFLARRPDQTVYYGDQDYELDFARRLGLSAVEIRYLATT